MILTLQASRSRRRSWSSSSLISRWGFCGGAGEPRRARLCDTPSLTRCWPPCPTSWSRLSECADPRSAFDNFAYPDWAPGHFAIPARDSLLHAEQLLLAVAVLKTVQLSKTLKEGAWCMKEGSTHTYTSEESRQKSYQRTLFEPQWTKMWPQGISVEVQHCVSVCGGKVGLFCRTNKRFLLQEVYFHDIVPEMRLCLSLFR